MPQFSLTVETTSNNNTGTAIQFLMPAARSARLLAVLIKQQASAAGENSGRWCVDRISAVSTGSALVPLELDCDSAASAISDTSITISTTLACSPTVVATTGDKILDLYDGWNYFTDNYGMRVYSGANQGFAIRRVTAPTGARVVVVQAIWSE